jgi:predicted enzyme related to lactoylglutathione lyase
VGEDWARPVVLWEIVARDPEAQANFYRRLCHWEIGEGPIMGIPAGLGGPEPGPAGHIRQGDRSGVSLYVQVRNLRASLERAVELGGRLVAEPFDVPGGPTLAVVDDPEGIPLVLVQQ